MLVATGLSLAGLAAGFLLLRRIPLLPAASETTSPINFSIIIPARDEEENLPLLLASLTQSPARPSQIIVVDDNSTDRTAAIATQWGATVLPSAPLPSGWTGKTWACHQGAIAAASENLLFLDADTRFAPEGFQRAASCFSRLPPDTALSILPFHLTQKPYEELSLFFNILMAAGAGGFSNLDKPRLFGQSLCIRRELYLRSGGHAVVRQHVLENLRLAKHIRTAGGDTQTFGGRDTLLIRMFPHGIAQLQQSWQKGFAGGAGVTSPIVLLLSIYWLTAATMAAISLLTHFTIAPLETSAIYLAFVLQIAWLAKQLGSFRFTTALCYPVPLVFYMVIFGRSAWLQQLGRPVNWKGRQI